MWMPGASRPVRAVVPSFAKINLSLKVLGKRSDGFHELRTVFQSITLADRLEIDYEPGRGSSVELESSIDIPDNLVTRAARALMDASSIRGSVRFRLHKRIPMGAGLGGGSSNAAAVLLALPALARKPVPLPELNAIAATLGSDVPFFLYGGAALGLGRGEQLYPLPDSGPRHALLVTSGIHVSTPAAFAALARAPLTELTPTAQANKMNRFQSVAWGMACASTSGCGWEAFCENDFEAAVFPKFPLLKSLHRKLNRSGASPARMTGSGSALFGVFPSREACERGLAAMGTLPPKVDVHKIRFSSRVQYRAAWQRALRVYLTEAAAWPPI
jgi:4-diphosphocytidyl-2-C-methyl-D-erythritol kinase